MNTRVFHIVIGVVAASLFSGTAYSQIHVQIGGGGNHYPRSQRRTYDHQRQSVQRTNNHYQQNQYRNLDHAIRDAVTRGTTNPHSSPYSSPRHGNSDRRRQINHYRADAYRNSRGGNGGAHHYQPRTYGYGGH